jgi:5-methylcytosine-specific restriction enzyme A
MPIAPRTLTHRRAKRTPERRKNRRERGYTWEWSDPEKREARIRMLVVRDGPYCKGCGQLLTAGASDIHIDHIVDHKGDYERFWDEANWQLMHARCHSAKTMRENKIK